MKMPKFLKSSVPPKRDKQNRTSDSSSSSVRKTCHAKICDHLFDYCPDSRSIRCRWRRWRSGLDRSCAAGNRRDLHHNLVCDRETRAACRLNPENNAYEKSNFLPEPLLKRLYSVKISQALWRVRFSGQGSSLETQSVRREVRLLPLRYCHRRCR
jgi:hypothetical protein